MKAINSIDLQSSKHEVCNSFMEIFIPQVKRNLVVNQNFAPQLAELERTAGWFADCLRNHKFSLLTEEVIAKDTRRDKKWTAAKYMIVAELESPDPAHKRAAEAVNRLFDSFGKIRTMGYAEQSGAMRSLCSDLLANHRPELELIGLVAVIEELQSANNDFVQAYSERTAATAEHQKGETIEAKRALITAYRILIYLVNGWILQHGSEGLDELIAFANRLIDQYRRIIGQKPSPGDDASLDEGLEDEELENEETGGGSGDSEDSENSEDPENPGGSDNTGGSTGSGSTGGGSGTPGSGSGNGTPIQPGPGGDDPDL